MSMIIGNDIYIAPGNELIVTVWWPGLDTMGPLHFVGPTTPALNTSLLFGHTGFRRWYTIADGTGYANYQFNVRCDGNPGDYTLFKVVAGGLT